MSDIKFNTIEEAIADFKAGKMVIAVDDDDLENEGSLLVAGEFATPEVINFMATNAKGLITMPISEEVARQLGLEALIWQGSDGEPSVSTVSLTRQMLLLEFPHRIVLQQLSLRQKQMLSQKISVCQVICSLR